MKRFPLRLIPQTFLGMRYEKLRQPMQPSSAYFTTSVARCVTLCLSRTDGAARETREEAMAAVEILAPYVHFDIPRIGQAYILFRARLAAPFTFGAGEETQEAALFSPADIPFSEVLRLYHAVCQRRRGIEQTECVLRGTLAPGQVQM